MRLATLILSNHMMVLRNQTFIKRKEKKNTHFASGALYSY